MLKIGDFSRLSRVSVRMLRYYDENNLLKPIKIDGFTGYRYYNEKQLETVGRIVALREMGFGVSSIREILNNEDDSLSMEKAFSFQQIQLEEEVAELQKRIQLLDTALKRLRKDEIMNYNCVIKQLPEKYVASVRQILPRYEEEGRLWHILFSESGVDNNITGPAMAILHDKEYKERDVDVEVQIEVKGKYPDTENVKFKTTPSVQVACTTFNGAYSQFPEVYAALATWVSENGYELCGPMMDIYHVGLNETRNPDEFVTEICCPVREK